TRHQAGRSEFRRRCAEGFSRTIIKLFRAGTLSWSAWKIGSWITGIQNGPARDNQILLWSIPVRSIEPAEGKVTGKSAIGSRQVAAEKSKKPFVTVSRKAFCGKSRFRGQPS